MYDGIWLFLDCLLELFCPTCNMNVLHFLFCGCFVLTLMLKMLYKPTYVHAIICKTLQHIYLAHIYLSSYSEFKKFVHTICIQYKSYDHLQTWGCCWFGTIVFQTLARMPWPAMLTHAACNYNWICALSRIEKNISNILNI